MTPGAVTVEALTYLFIILLLVHGRGLGHARFMSPWTHEAQVKLADQLRPFLGFRHQPFRVFRDEVALLDSGKLSDKRCAYLAGKFAAHRKPGLA